MKHGDRVINIGQLPRLMSLLTRCNLRYNGEGRGERARSAGEYQIGARTRNFPRSSKRERKRAGVPPAGETIGPFQTSLPSGLINSRVTRSR